MDRLKQQGNWAKFCKTSFKEAEKTSPRGYKFTGPTHITQAQYGTSPSGVPLTNKYLKKVKEGLKREYRAVKRGEKQLVRKEINSILLD